MVYVLTVEGAHIEPPQTQLLPFHAIDVVVRTLVDINIYKMYV